MAVARGIPFPDVYSYRVYRSIDTRTRIDKFGSRVTFTVRSSIYHRCSDVYARGGGGEGTEATSLSVETPCRTGAVSRVTTLRLSSAHTRSGRSREAGNDDERTKETSYRVVSRSIASRRVTSRHQHYISITHPLHVR